MRTFFSMKRGKLTSPEFLAESPNFYEWQSRLNATSHPHLWSCYSSLHFRAAFWSPIAPACFICFIKGRQKAEGDWQQAESGFCSFCSSLSPLHSWETEALRQESGPPKVTRPAEGPTGLKSHATPQHPHSARPAPNGARPWGHRPFRPCPACHEVIPQPDLSPHLHMDHDRGVHFTPSLFHSHVHL